MRTASGSKIGAMVGVKIFGSYPRVGEVVRVRTTYSDTKERVLRVVSSQTDFVSGETSHFCLTNVVR